MTEKQLNMRRLGMEASYLASCALHGTLAQYDESWDLEKLYKFCKFHSITSIVAMALEPVWREHPADPEIMKKWRQARDKAIRKNVLLNAEREQILAYLESIGCWYMPLKGSLLQFDYPQFGMRQMSDNDILFDERMTGQVHDFMLSKGYTCPNYGLGKDDEYQKPPVYNIEMHRALFGNALYPELAAYYRDVKNRLLPNGQGSYGYHFTDEDFYIYMVTHAYKHYIHGGIGIRNMLDIYVYVSSHGENMDWAYTERELRTLGAWEFDVSCRKLGMQLFGKPAKSVDLTEEDRLTLDIYFTSGTFGTEQQAVEKRLEKTAGEHGGRKICYIWSRLFPNMEYMKERDPILRQKPWLAPLYYVKRFLVIFRKRRKAIQRELKNLKKAK